MTAQVPATDLAQRGCGACTACCTLAYVPELQKPEGATCVHCEGGCLIYAGRPSSCEEYKCEWLKGNLPDALRPDRCGAMVEVYPEMVAILLIPGQTVSDLGTVLLEKVDHYVSQGLPVIATGQFAKLPPGMSKQQAEERLLKTVKEYRR